MPPARPPAGAVATGSQSQWPLEAPCPANLALDGSSLGGGGSRSLSTDQRGVLPCCSLLAWAVPPGGLSLGPAPRLGPALGHAFWAAGIPAVCHGCLADSCLLTCLPPRALSAVVSLSQSLCPTRRSSLSPATGRLDQQQPGGSGVVPTGPMDGQRGSGGGGHCILGPDMLLCVRETASLPRLTPAGHLGPLPGRGLRTSAAQGLRKAERPSVSQLMCLTSRFLDAGKAAGSALCTRRPTWQAVVPAPLQVDGCQVQGPCVRQHEEPLRQLLVQQLVLHLQLGRSRQQTPHDGVHPAWRRQRRKVRPQLSPGNRTRPRWRTRLLLNKHLS